MNQKKCLIIGHKSKLLESSHLGTLYKYTYNLEFMIKNIKYKIF